MVANRLQPTNHTAAVPARGTSGTSAPQSTTVQLRGKDLEQQAALLDPARGGYAAQSAALAPVQRRGGGDTANVHEAAQHGVASGGGAIPHHDAIQRAFGHHDVSGIQSHVGGKAAEASAMMGADAYATGNHVAFGKSPDLHTAAHEAAHVVQQRGGVSLLGGVGQQGDVYERHADAVADKVVRGESAAGLLDSMSDRGAERATQRQEGGAARDAGAVQQRAAVQMRGGKAESFYGDYDLSGTVCSDAHIFQGEVVGTDPKGLHAYSDGGAPGGVTILATIGNVNAVHLIIWTKGAAAQAKRAKWSSMFPKAMSKGMVSWYIRQRLGNKATTGEPGFEMIDGKKVQRPGTGWSGIALGKAGDTVYPMSGASYTSAPGYQNNNNGPEIVVGDATYKIVNP